MQIADLFSGMSVDDIPAALAFYRDTLGLEVEEGPNGLLVRGNGHAHFLYPKPDHRPATYTALYLAVPDIDEAVDTLAAAGVTMEQYEGMHQDDKGIARGKAAGMGPDIAWFTDPAGNIIAVLTE
ncbi:MAG TPA: VOC family protein [Pseudolysinimonas sp.]|nr:VOC family protein [Pseudolysinimonas sp.]